MRYYPKLGTTPFRGVAGGRVRENDEHHVDLTPPAGREITARFAGVCAASGAAIRPGDRVRYDSATHTVVLVRR
jgi:hypothetical protein